MSQIINIIHKKKGGVWEVVKRLQSHENLTVTANFNIFFNILKKRDCELFFHQPTSHLYALLLFLFGFPKKNMTIVLHESVSYNYNHTFQSFLKVIIRFIVIQFTGLLGMKILAVSDFIMKSYKLKNIEKIDYRNLFVNEIDLFKDNSTKMVKDEKVVVAWQRLGTHKKTTEIISNLISNHKVSIVILLGNLTEIENTNLELSKTFPEIVVKQFEFLPKIDFYKLLQRSFWFVSAYEKEGFGLSIFEASKFGCICLSPPSGAVLEWLPETNFLIYEKILRQESIDNELLIKTIENNLQ